MGLDVYTLQSEVESSKKNMIKLSIIIRVIKQEGLSWVVSPEINLVRLCLSQQWDKEEKMTPICCPRAAPLPSSPCSSPPFVMKRYLLSLREELTARETIN